MPPKDGISNSVDLISPDLHCLPSPSVRKLRIITLTKTAESSRAVASVNSLSQPYDVVI